MPSNNEITSCLGSLSWLSEESSQEAWEAWGETDTRGRGRGRGSILVTINCLGLAKVLAGALLIKTESMTGPAPPIGRK